MQPTIEPLNGSLSLKELAEILVKNSGYTEGFYEAAFEFQIGVGGIGPDKSQTVPGVAVGIHRIGLHKIAEMNHNSVDASTINKPQKVRSKKS